MNPNTEKSITEEEYPIEKYPKSINVERVSYIDPAMVSFPLQALDYIGNIVISRGLINDRIEKIANQIIEEYKDSSLTLLVIMKGAVVFASALQAKMAGIAKNNISFGNTIQWEYVTVSSYSNTTSTGEFVLKSAESVLLNLKGKDILVVEDVFDSGKSLFYLDKLLKKYEFKSLRYAFLFLKKNPKNLSYLIEFDYLGFMVPNDFLIGFGLDYNECFRELEHLCVINEKGIEKFKKK
mmetsp:Transcript_29212/g.30332  ORF Transcript_29212/g.30332 Transcript_29212/m.30332 type:complete len:238 (+) Transcript_29212:31-744(+)